MGERALKMTRSGQPTTSMNEKLKIHLQSVDDINIIHSHDGKPFCIII